MSWRGYATCSTKNPMFAASAITSTATNWMKFRKKNIWKGKLYAYSIEIQLPKRRQECRQEEVKIPGMCAQGPPSYSELETNDRARLRREAALAQVNQDATYCVHYSSLREILNSQDLADRIARHPEGGLTHIEYLHQVPADAPQDPRHLWLRKQGPNSGAVTVTNAAEDPWDLV